MSTLSKTQLSSQPLLVCMHTSPSLTPLKLQFWIRAKATSTPPTSHITAPGATPSPLSLHLNQLHSMQALRGTPCTQKCSTSLSGSRQLLLRAPAPIRSRRGSGQRASVVVEANLFARAVRVIQSYANQIGECTCAEAAQLHCFAVVDTQPQLCTVFALAVSAAEDPEKLLDQVVNEMQEDLIKMRQASAQVGFHHTCTASPHRLRAVPAPQLPQL